MQIKSRQDLLLVIVGVALGLLLLDNLLVEPAIKRWKSQSERIADLEKKVILGRQLVARQNSIRARWDEMLRGDLNSELSAAEEQASAGIAKWATGSRIIVNSLSPNWRMQDEEYDLFELRATATGTQAQLGQFIYGLETDALPVRLEECELTARDAKGQQLTGALRFSFIRLKEGRSKP